MSSLDPADLAELGRQPGASLIGQGRQGPPGDPRLLLNPIEPGQAVTKDADGNPAPLDVVTKAQSRVSFDTDGVPYYDTSGIAFETAVPVLADTDGVPYLGA